METSSKVEEEEYADSSSDSILSDEWQELSKSDYAKVIFCDLYHHPDSGDVGCMFQITDNVHEDPCDFVGLFRVGYDNLAQCLVSKMLSETECEEDGKLLRCVFKCEDLPDLEDGFYQFLYVTRDQEVCGASMPFEIKQARPKGESSDDDVVAEKAEDDFVLVRHGLEKKNQMLEELLEKYRSKHQTLTLDMESLINSKDKACQEKEDVISNLNQEILCLKGQSADMQSLIKEKECTIQNLRDNQQEEILKFRNERLREENIQLTRELKKLKRGLQDKEEALSLIEPERRLLIEQVDDQKFMIRALEDSKSLALKEMSELSESLSKRTKVLNQTRCELATFKGKWKEASTAISQQVEKTNKLSQEVKDLIQVLGDKEDHITKQVIKIESLEAEKRMTDAVAQLQKEAKLQMEFEKDVLSETQRKVEELNGLVNTLLETTNFSCTKETQAFLGIKIQMIMLVSMMRKPGISSINELCCLEAGHNKDTPEKRSVFRLIPAELQDKQNGRTLPQNSDEEEKKMKRSLPQVIPLPYPTKPGSSTTRKVCSCPKQPEKISQKVKNSSDVSKRKRENDRAFNGISDTTMNAMRNCIELNIRMDAELLQKHASAMLPVGTTPTKENGLVQEAPSSSGPCPGVLSQKQLMNDRIGGTTMNDAMKNCLERKMRMMDAKLLKTHASAPLPVGPPPTKENSLVQETPSSSEPCPGVLPQKQLMNDTIMNGINDAMNTLKNCADLNIQRNKKLLQKHPCALLPVGTTPTKENSLVKETASASEACPGVLPQKQPMNNTAGISSNSVAPTSQACGQTLKAEHKEQDALTVYTKCGHIIMEDIQNITRGDIVMVNRLTDRISKVDSVITNQKSGNKDLSYSDADCDSDSGEDQDGHLTQQFSMERDMFKLERITRIIKQFLCNVNNWSNVVQGCNLSYESLPVVDQIDIMMDECKSRYQLEILLEYREKQKVEMKELQDKICDLLAKQKSLNEEVLDLKTQRSELRTRLGKQDKEFLKLQEECTKKGATVEAVNAEKTGMLQKEAQLHETVADHSARLTEAAELYKKMFLEIKKLKRRIKKSKSSKSSSKVTSDVSGNSSENDIQLPNTQRLQPLRNTSDSDTGEHVLGNNTASPCPTTLQENISLEAAISQPVVSSNGETKQTSSETICVPFINENVVSSTSATANSLLTMTEENKPDPSTPVVIDMKSMQRLLTEKLSSISESSLPADKLKDEVFDIPCFLCNTTFSISSQSTEILMDHFETAHQLQMCPICGQLFEPCIPKKYFYYHVEDHFKSE